MLRALLIVAWSASVLFFVWEFVMANSLPERYSKLNPNTFRIVDVAFLVVVALTLYYLIADK